mmetsp:Transcript_51227/g.123656  ORF Transcript_51227/g.123656 Transcript_51227/m.123656 type:complete len:80 (-) Transcript_51227:91-330(-)
MVDFLLENCGVVTVKTRCGKKKRFGEGKFLWTDQHPAIYFYMQTCGDDVCVRILVYFPTPEYQVLRSTCLLFTVSLTVT